MIDLVVNMCNMQVYSSVVGKGAGAPLSGMAHSGHDLTVLT